MENWYKTSIFYMLEDPQFVCFVVDDSADFPGPCILKIEQLF